LDNSVNILDVMTMVNHILEINEIDNCNLTNADMDQNIQVNILDVILVVNIILEQSSEMIIDFEFPIEINEIL
jgi:hypothetical protein